MIGKSALLLLAAATTWAAANPGLAQIKTVYLMPMSRGLDQFLAAELAAEGVFEVVTDPGLAQAVLTDRIGPVFEQSFAELYPAPPAPAEEPAPDGAAEAKDTVDSRPVGALLAERPETPRLTSSFSRGRGNLFLVDRDSRTVLWSEFLRPKNSRPQELNRTAERLVGRLKRSVRASQNASTP